MKVHTLKPLLDIMSHLAMQMPHLASFEGSKGHGTPSDVGCPNFKSTKSVVADQNQDLLTPTSDCRLFGHLIVIQCPMLLLIKLRVRNDWT